MTCSTEPGQSCCSTEIMQRPMSSCSRPGMVGVTMETRSALKVGSHHALDDFTKMHHRLETQDALGFAAVPYQQIDVGRAVEAHVGNHELAPIQASDGECDLAELFDRMSLASGETVVARHRQRGDQRQ